MYIKRDIYIEEIMSNSLSKIDFNSKQSIRTLHGKNRSLQSSVSIHWILTAEPITCQCKKEGEDIPLMKSNGIKAQQGICIGVKKHLG